MRIYAIKLLYVIFCALCVSSFSFAQQTVYEKSTAREPDLGDACYRGGIPLEAYVRNKSSQNLQNIRDSYDGSAIQQLGNINDAGYAETPCNGTHTASIELYDIQEDGDLEFNSNIPYGDSDWGALQSVNICPPSAYTEATFALDNEDGFYCYDPAELTFNSDCFTENLYIADASSPEQACHTKDDGSQCMLVKDEHNGQNFYYENSEPSTCYITGTEAYDADNLPTAPTGNDCQDIGNGVVMCPENETNVCDENGCLKGCGSYTFDGVEQFVCLSNDNDGDGVGDYIDPDIDGDGIPNEDDGDVDGDGVPNEQDDDYEGNDGNGNGDGDFNGTVIVNIDNSGIGEEIENALIEQADFDNAAIDNAFNSAATDIENATNTFLNDSNLDLSNTVDSDITNALNTVKQHLEPTACELTFDISLHTGSQVNFCTYIEPLKPILSIVFAIGTFWFGFTRISTTIRG